MDLHFPIDSVDMMRFEFAGHETVPYVFQLIREIAGKKDTTMLKWWSTDAFFDLEKKDMPTPGHYELIIQRAHFIEHPDERQLLRIPFEVQPPPALEKKVSLRQLLPYILGAIAFIGLAFFAYYRINKRRLRIARQKSDTIGLQLKSIQSQLNPHFMFNALAAIQSLMNKKDIDGANHYLAKFADLTREVLHTADAEMISLEDELKILDDYLQMEQLRFGFSYDFDVASGINRANTEIPVMLLQPFVENAVKHGVSGLHNEGRITITVSTKEKNLILQIADNGKGFDKQNRSPAGFGLKLSAQRIVLLNQRYKAGRIALDLDSRAAGTIVTIKLDHWL
jgi:signal transduction histidine kinase